MNAKQEFLELVGNNKVLCATILKNNEITKYGIAVGHTEEQYNDFINLLDFNYDNGYGAQYISGTIWFTDGTWANRSEYDGVEWWTHHVCPEIPKYLL